MNSFNVISLIFDFLFRSSLLSMLCSIFANFGNQPLFHYKNIFQKFKLNLALLTLKVRLSQNAVPPISLHNELPCYPAGCLWFLPSATFPTEKKNKMLTIFSFTAHSLNLTRFNLFFKFPQRKDDFVNLVRIKICNY